MAARFAAAKSGDPQQVSVSLDLPGTVRIVGTVADVFDGDVQVFQQPVPMGGGASAQTRSPLSASAI